MKIYNKKNQHLFDIDISSAFASGGEGSICNHPTKKNIVVKIYHQQRDLSLESALLELSKLSNIFVKPVDIFYSMDGRHILGFSMNYIDTKKFVVLKKIFNHTYCLQNGYDKKIKYKIYQTIKSAVSEAHSIGITIGDLNPYNILVNDKGDVVFLDVDSYGTKNKQHSGVLLEDIRDWVNHPKVNSSTDSFAFDILTFWMFTYMHPYRGDYPAHKTLEERVVKKSSVLSGLPINTPKCYQPFTNQEIINQFKEIFQNDKRFLVDLSGQPQILQIEFDSNPVIINSKDLYIREISSSQHIVISENFAAIKINDVWTVYNLANYGMYNPLYTINCDDVYIGNKNVLYRKNNSIYNKSSVIKNTNEVVNTTTTFVDGSLVSYITGNDGISVMDIDNIMNNNILSSNVPLFIQSLNFGDNGCWQIIGNNKWILDFNGSKFNLVKTPFNIKNIYKRKKYVLIEHVDKNKTRYTMCKIDGLDLVVGCDLKEWKYFDVKSDYIFIPEDGKIEMLNPANNWKIISEIECSVSTFDSRIYHTNAGMVIQNANKIYLINKK